MDGWPFRVGLSLAHHIYTGPAPGSRLAIAATAERSTAEAQWRTATCTRTTRKAGSTNLSQPNSLEQKSS